MTATKFELWASVEVPPNLAREIPYANVQEGESLALKRRLLSRLYDAGWQVNARLFVEHENFFVEGPGKATRFNLVATTPAMVGFHTAPLLSEFYVRVRQSDMDFFPRLATFFLPTEDHLYSRGGEGVRLGMEPCTDVNDSVHGLAVLAVRHVTDRVVLETRRFPCFGGRVAALHSPWIFLGPQVPQT